MCGIAGIYSCISPVSQYDIDQTKKMNAIQKHRGPDDEGLFYDNYCVLGHRRLAIIDLSKDGHQPFVSDDNRYQLVYNGEIYNYIELRAELKQLGWAFHSKTDTEVLLKAYQQYGKECLNKFNGMFAFVIYDSGRNEIFLARDRVGIKPLYYTVIEDKFYFASEIKALCSISDLDKTVNYQSIFDYLVFNRTDVFDDTFFNEIKRIPKGHYGVINDDGLVLTQWWNPEDYLQTDKNKTTSDEIYHNIDEILTSAVEFRMRSDVPVGSCLSGGLDSSILTGIHYTHHDIEDNYATFTSSFPDHPIDETRYIDSLNRKYPFKNYRTFPTADSAYSNLKEFVYFNDEPAFNPSFYSQYEVMRLSKKHGVTVLLDGQGGDENFAGYHYFHGFYLNGLLRKKRVIKTVSELLKILLRNQDRTWYQTLLFQLFPDKTRKKLLLKTLPYIKPDFFYQYIDTSKIFNEFFNAPDLNTSLVRHFQYKLEHLLRMEDRNSMAFSLEARVPYLDHRLIEYVLSLPEDRKIKAGETKYLQKKAVGKYTVSEILNRKDKIGFGTPRDEWMQTELWQGFTKKNYPQLVASFPDIFEKEVSLLNGGLEYWKINQLAVWKEVFLD